MLPILISQSWFSSHTELWRSRSSLGSQRLMSAATWRADLCLCFNASHKVLVRNTHCRHQDVFRCPALYLYVWLNMICLVFIGLITRDEHTLCVCEKTFGQSQCVCSIQDVAVAFQHSRNHAVSHRCFISTTACGRDSKCMRAPAGSVPGTSAIASADTQHVDEQNVSAIIETATSEVAASNTAPSSAGLAGRHCSGAHSQSPSIRTRRLRSPTRS